MGGLVLVTPPAAEPITLAEARLYLKDPPTADDALISSLITAARRRAEERQNRAYLTQTWDYFVDAFPSDMYEGLEIELPRSPLQSVTSVKYTIAAGTEFTVATSDYYVDTARHPGRVLPVVEQTWPTDVLRIANGVAIRFAAGYGAAGSDVPAQIVTALKQLIAHWYFNRDAMPTIPDGIDAQLLEGYARSYA